MAHFSKVVDGVVTDVIVIKNDDLNGKEFPDSEPIGQAFIAALAENEPRLEGDWFQTSYNTNQGIHYDNMMKPDNKEGFRLNFGHIGYIFDADAGEYGEFKPNEGGN